MRPSLHRGQPPAKGIPHIDQRTPVTLRPGILGGPIGGDPRGYWLGQHEATPERKARRKLIAHLGRRQFLKQIKERRRATF